MQLAMIGAFPFPHPQGSQVYFEGQARALARAGATPVLVTYASAHRSSLDIEHRTTPRVFSPPAALRSGPNLGKPLADLALLATYLSAHARRPFDAVLAHNAEAAVVAIAARALIGVPVVYVAHTILRHELSAYGSPRWRSALDRVGDMIDVGIASRADGIIALNEDAAAMLEARAGCEIAIVPPGLDPSEAPSAEQQERACRRFGLTPRRFALYAGNLDSYQELQLLDAAAADRRASDIPVVVATHDARGLARSYPDLEIVEVSSFDEARALHFAAEALVMTRRRPGGFPIKLLNYMEAARPIVAFEHIAAGLVDGESACLLPRSAGPSQLVAALRRLRADSEAASRIGDAARRHLLARHGWTELAARTLRFTQGVAARVKRRRSSSSVDRTT